MSVNCLVEQDIYEATEFHPLNTSNVDAAANDEIYFCVIKFSIHRISTVLHSMYGCSLVLLVKIIIVISMTLIHADNFLSGYGCLSSSYSL